MESPPPKSDTPPAPLSSVCALEPPSGASLPMSSAADLLSMLRCSLLGSLALRSEELIAGSVLVGFMQPWESVWEVTFLWMERSF